MSIFDGLLPEPKPLAEEHPALYEAAMQLHRQAIARRREAPWQKRPDAFLIPLSLRPAGMPDGEECRVFGTPVIWSDGRLGLFYGVPQ